MIDQELQNIFHNLIELNSNTNQLNPELCFFLQNNENFKDSFSRTASCYAAWKGYRKLSEAIAVKFGGGEHCDIFGKTAQDYRREITEEKLRNRESTENIMRHTIDAGRIGQLIRKKMDSDE